MTEIPQPDRCPSDLSLERYSLFELEPERQRALRAHAQGCERCRGRLTEMEAQGAQFRSSDQAIRARDVFHRVDRRWRWKMFAAALVPLAAAALGVGIPLLHSSTPAVTVVNPSPAQAREPSAAQRTFLEPRGDDLSPPRLRTISLGGREVQFGQGSLEAEIGSGVRPFTLRHTDVDAAVSGFAARVSVTQEFVNPFSEPVEAIYVFPLPDNAAVDDMKLIVGERVIRGVVKERSQARYAYERAKAQGRRAALLDQERPNIFTQSIANIQPGETIKVTLRYAQPLKYDDGQFEFNFPMVVGPRYIPGNPVPGASQGTGWSADTDRVIDASRITPPVLAPGMRSGRDISVTLRIDAGVPIEGLTSVSHRLEVERPSAREAEIQLAPTDTTPNKDLIVRYRVAGSELRSAVLSHRGAGGGYFALLVQPESEETHPAVVPKEMMFIIDTSCSMTGRPLAAAKQAMRKAIRSMNPDDTFMLIDFATSASTFHPSPLPNTQQNVDRALSYLDALPAQGGTNQLQGIRAALLVPPDPTRLRTVLLLTDGFIGNEAEIFAETDRVLGSARIFSLGIGTSVNHFFLSRLAELGRGFYQYVRPDEDSTAAIERFRRRIAKPLLTDVEIDWGGLAVTEVLPARIPDLFDSQPLIVLGKYTRAGRARVVVHGVTAGRPRETAVDVDLPEQDDRNEVLGSMWARAKIEGLERQQYATQRSDIIRQITSLGVEHHLMTQYTSFVAVDETRASNPNQPTPTVVEPTEMPELDDFGEGKSGGRFKVSRLIQGQTFAPVHGVLAMGMGMGMGAGGFGASNGRLLGTQSVGGHGRGFGALGLGGAGPGGGGGGANGPTYADRVQKTGKGANPNKTALLAHESAAGQVTSAAPKPDNSKNAEMQTAFLLGRMSVIGSNLFPGERNRISCVAAKETYLAGHASSDADPALARSKFEEVVALANPTCDFYAKAAKRLEGLRAPAESRSNPVPQSLSEVDIVKVIMSNRSAIVACVQRYTETHTDSVREIAMKWTLRPDGGTDHVRCVLPRSCGTELDSCLSSLIQSWHFPRFSGPPSWVRFPLLFRTEEVH
jgi:Ca-activated chloride channel homolog